MTEWCCLEELISVERVYSIGTENLFVLVSGDNLREIFSLRLVV